MKLEFRLFEHLGKYLIMLQRMFSKPVRWEMYRKELFRQMTDIGVGSAFIVLLVSVFIGAVTAVQTAYQLYGTPFVPSSYIGLIVRNTIIFELAPTFTALILAGKVGSNLASELGSMRVTEQIDALETMGVNTESYLIATRIVAGFITIPLLVAIAAYSGILGGYIATSTSTFYSTDDYARGIRMLFDPFDVQLMFIKSFTFAFILSSISCYMGYYVKGGSVEIGKASTQAVVYSCIFILVADYVIAALLL
ncbi:MAG: MlaE family ABC transporter permease [Chitinophagales bacterium]